MTTEHLDIGDDLVFTRMKRRDSAGGTWVTGRLAGHRFSALVFPEHAENAEWELGDSRISKLWLKRLADGQTAFNWDRGADVAAIDETAQAVVDFLCAGLADAVFTTGRKG